MPLSEASGCTASSTKCDSGLVTSDISGYEGSTPTALEDIACRTDSRILRSPRLASTGEQYYSGAREGESKGNTGIWARTIENLARA